MAGICAVIGFLCVVVTCPIDFVAKEEEKMPLWHLFNQLRCCSTVVVVVVLSMCRQEVAIKSPPHLLRKKNGCGEWRPAAERECWSRRNVKNPFVSPSEFIIAATRC